MLPLSSAWTLQNSSMGDDINYSQAMWHMVRAMLTLTREERSSLSRSVEVLAELDDTYNHTQPHLRHRSQCKTLQEHLLHISLQLYYHFHISVVCRPVLQKAEANPGCPHYLRLHSRVKDSLIGVSRAFLEFIALSLVPLRTWSSVHIGLSAALLLRVWDETRDDPTCRELQQQVIDAFGRPKCGNASIGPKETVGNSQWLSDGHIRALDTLVRSIRTEPLSSEDISSAAAALPRKEPQEDTPCPESASQLGPEPSDESSAAYGYELVNVKALGLFSLVLRPRC